MGGQLLHTDPGQREGENLLKLKGRVEEYSLETMKESGQKPRQHLHNLADYAASATISRRSLAAG